MITTIREHFRERFPFWCSLGYSTYLVILMLLFAFIMYGVLMYRVWERKRGPYGQWWDKQYDMCFIEGGKLEIHKPYVRCVNGTGGLKWVKEYKSDL